MTKWLTASAAGTVAAMVPAALDVLIDAGFGASDLWVFLFWTVPFTGALSAFCLVLFFDVRGGPWSMIVAVGVGVVAAMGWTLLVALLLGPWVHAFGLPILVCWMAGGVCAAMAVRGLGIATLSKRAVALQVLAPLAVVTLWVSISDRVESWYRSEQALQTILMEWDRKPAEPLSIEDDVALELDVRQIAWLRDVTGDRGRLLVNRWSPPPGTEYEAQMVIVLHRQVDGYVVFRQPKRSKVIHFQTEDGWRSFPAEMPTLDRRLDLQPASWDPHRTFCRIEGSRGQMTGSTPYFWP